MTEVLSRIRTSYVNPPIPIRDFDWVAWIDGEEDGFRGHGRTEQAARVELASMQAMYDPEPMPAVQVELPPLRDVPPGHYLVVRNRQLREALTQETVFRFKVGDKVWVHDRSHGLGGGYSIVEATVREQHSHPERHPDYPHGEGYVLDGDLWWDCYPGCRVFAAEAEAA